MNSQTSATTTKKTRQPSVWLGDKRTDSRLSVWHRIQTEDSNNNNNNKTTKKKRNNSQNLTRSGGKRTISTSNASPSKSHKKLRQICCNVQTRINAFTHIMVISFPLNRRSISGSICFHHNATVSQAYYFRNSVCYNLQLFFAFFLFSLIFAKCARACARTRQPPFIDKPAVSTLWKICKPAKCATNDTDRGVAKKQTTTKKKK